MCVNRPFHENLKSFEYLFLWFISMRGVRNIGGRGRHFPQ